MKRNILFLLFIVPIFSTMSAQNNVKSAFLLKWENSKNYLLEIAEAMPKATYKYKPTERQMSFQEQLLHIRSNMVWLSEKYFVNGTYKKPEKIDSKTKEEVILQLTNSFNKVAEIIKTISEEDLTTEVDFFAGKKSKLQLLNLIQDHVTHHRGQLIVYLNLNNIEPPKYSGW